MLEDAARRSELDSYLVEAGSMIPEAARSTSATELLSFPPEILLHIRGFLSYRVRNLDVG